MSMESSPTLLQFIVDIYFTAIGMFDIPSEEEINAVMKRMESERETA